MLEVVDIAGHKEEQNIENYYHVQVGTLTSPEGVVEVEGMCTK